MVVKNKIKVGVIDSTVSLTLNKIRRSLCLARRFGKSSARHGTFTVSAITDIAETDLFIAHGDLSSIENFIEMLRWMNEQEIDILNLSLAYEKEIPEAKEIFENISKKGTWIFSAWNPRLIFPWSYDCCLSVGKGGLLKDYPDKWQTIGVGGITDTMSGSSVATALASGFCASQLAENSNLTKDEFMQKRFIFTPMSNTFKQKPKLVEL